MKPKNFPARKLRRQLFAKGGWDLVMSTQGQKLLAEAKQIRTKKRRAN